MLVWVRVGGSLETRRELQIVGGRLHKSPTAKIAVRSQGGLISDLSSVPLILAARKTFRLTKLFLRTSSYLLL
jgi:hypothetical protein